MLIKVNHTIVSVYCYCCCCYSGMRREPQRSEIQYKLPSSAFPSYHILVNIINGKFLISTNLGQNSTIPKNISSHKIRQRNHKHRVVLLSPLPQKMLVGDKKPASGTHQVNKKKLLQVIFSLNFFDFFFHVCGTCM